MPDGGALKPMTRPNPRRHRPDEARQHGSVAGRAALPGMPIRRGARRNPRIISRGTESLLTLRWRELDSNRRFPVMRPGRGIRFAKMAPRRRETDSNRRSLSCTHRPLVAEGNAVAIERGSLVIVVFLMRARGIPLPPPVCP